MSLPIQPQISAPNTGVNVGANPFANISNLINQTMQDRKQDLQEKEDRQYLLQQRKAQQGQLDQQAAQQKLNMLKPILLGDPKKAADPQYVNLTKQIHDQLGIPAPMNPDGSIDLNEFKTPWNQVDDKMSQFILTLPKAQRKSLLDRYSGVPQDAYATDAFISAKDQAALQRARVSGIHEDAWEDIQKQRTQISSDRAHAYETGNYAHVAELDANTQKIKADTQRIFEQTREMPMKLQQQQQRLNDQLERTKQIGQRGAAGGFQYTRLLNSEATSSARLFTEADNAYKSQLTAYQTALSNNADPDSPEMQAAKQQLDQTGQRRDSLKSTYDNAQNFLSGEAAALATGSHVSSATGNPTTVVGGSSSSKPLGQAPAGLAPGNYEVKGRKVEVRADGNYYAV